MSSVAIYFFTVIRLIMMFIIQNSGPRWNFLRLEYVEYLMCISSEYLADVKPVRGPVRSWCAIYSMHHERTGLKLCCSCAIEHNNYVTTPYRLHCVHTIMSTFTMYTTPTMQFSDLRSIVQGTTPPTSNYLD